MEKKTGNLWIGTAILYASETLLVVLFKVLLKFENIDFLIYVFLPLNAIWIIYVLLVYKFNKERYDLEISRIIGKEAKEALHFGHVGIIVCDENRRVNWASDYIVDKQLCAPNDNLLEKLPSLAELVNGNETEAEVELGKRKYQIIRGDGEGVLLVKDITELAKITKTYNNERIVEGLVNLDNYAETIQYEDEQKIAIINTNIRQKVIEWVTECGGIVKRVRSDRLLIFISDQKFQKMVRSKFGILEEVKKEAAKLDVMITASMTFACCYSNLTQMDETVYSLMELALSRGGDQVIVKENGKDLRFYGNSSKATENTSKVKARIMTQTLENLIRESDNVIIVPHVEADLDCLGSCLALSRFVQQCGKKAYVLFNEIRIEPKTKELFNTYLSRLMARHEFVNQKEAKAVLNKNSLVIATDHHSLDLSSYPRLMSLAQKVVVVDHHRRKSENNIKSLMIYNEPSASSVVEMVCEMLRYHNEPIELSELEATVMYAGLMVDTDSLRSRCTARTFETCAYLKNNAADVELANDWLKESINEFSQKMNILSRMEIVEDSIAICCVEKEHYYSRTALAQAANYLCTIKDLDAAFVIGESEPKLAVISGRSNGKVNCQVILERMGGGGHFTAAGMQRKDADVNALKEELIEAINGYQQGEKDNESNPVM